MVIRKIIETDSRDQISRIYVESWKHAYQGIVPQDYPDGLRTDVWAARIDAAGRHTLAAEEGGFLIGTAAYSASRSPQMDGYGEINSIYLLPKYIGKGYGRPLLQAAMKGLNELGFEELFLWVLEENLSAQRFYARCGFVRGDAVRCERIGGKSLREIQYCYHGNSKRDPL